MSDKRTPHVVHFMLVTDLELWGVIQALLIEHYGEENDVSVFPVLIVVLAGKG